MIVEIRYGLPLVTVTIVNGGLAVVIPEVLLDTGSGGCLFRCQDMARIGLVIDGSTPTHRIRGIGGTERISLLRVDRISADPLEVSNLHVGVVAVDYGFGIRGILGMDFLLQARAVIDLATLELRSGGT